LETQRLGQTRRPAADAEADSARTEKIAAKALELNSSANNSCLQWPLKKPICPWLCVFNWLPL
jgi:hypothetical protein